MTDEIFGPILPLLTFKKIDEAIEFINARDKPLALYYYGKVRDNANKEKVIAQCSAGSLAVNECVLHISNLDLPFGGVGKSGMGRYHGIEGFKNFSNAKSVFVKVATNFKPFNTICPPWTPEKEKFVSGLLGEKPPVS